HHPLPNRDCAPIQSEDRSIASLSALMYGALHYLHLKLDDAPARLCMPRRGLPDKLNAKAPGIKSRAPCLTVVGTVLPRHRLRRARRAGDPAVLPADRPRRYRRWLREAAAEQPGEEALAASALGRIVAAGAAGPAAVAPQRRAVGHGQDLAVRDVDPVLDRHVGDPFLGPVEQRDQRPVAAVDVLAEFELAGIVDERGLIGQVHRDEGREVDVDLARPVHPLDALDGVALAR